MKSVLVLFGLLMGANSMAQGGDVDQGTVSFVEASFRYECTLGKESFDGTVELLKGYIAGQPVCMNFAQGGSSVCWRLERHYKVNEVFLALRYLNQLEDEPTADNNFISMGSFNYVDGATITQTVKVHRFKKDELNCVLTKIVK